MKVHEAGAISHKLDSIYDSLNSWLHMGLPALVPLKEPVNQEPLHRELVLIQEVYHVSPASV